VVTFDQLQSHNHNGKAASYAAILNHAPSPATAAGSQGIASPYKLCLAIPVSVKARSCHLNPLQKKIIKLYVDF